MRTLRPLPVTAVVLLLAACSPTTEAHRPSSTPSASATPFRVSGTVVVPNDFSDLNSDPSDGDLCTAAHTYEEDVRAGGTVLVADAAGGVIARGTIGAGRMIAGPEGTVLDARCRFPFTLGAVPGGRRVYVLSFGRGNAWSLRVTASELAAGPRLELEGTAVEQEHR